MTTRWFSLTLAVCWLAAAIVTGGVIHQLWFADNVALRLANSGLFAPAVPRLISVPEKLADGSVHPLLQAGAREGDLVVAIRGQRGGGGAVRSTAEITWQGRSIAYGEPWILTLQREGPDSNTALYEVGLPAWERGGDDLWAGLLIFAFIVLPLSALLAALFLLVARPGDVRALIAAVMFLTFSTMFRNDHEALALVPRWIAYFSRPLIGALTAPIVMTFFLLFPSPGAIDRRWPWLKWVALGWALCRGVVGAFTNVMIGHAPDFYSTVVLSDLGKKINSGWGVSSSVLGFLFALIGIVALIQRRAEAESLDEQRRLRLLLVGILITWIPLGVLIIWQLLAPVPAWLLTVVAITAPFWPWMFVYVVLRHRVFGISVIIRRGLQYAIVSRGLWVLIFLVFSGLFISSQMMLKQVLPLSTNNAVFGASVAVAAGLSIAVRGLTRRVMPAIDRRFFRESYDARQILQQLGAAVRQLAGQRERLLSTVVHQVHAALHPRSIIIYLRQSAIRTTMAYGEERQAGSATADRFVRVPTESAYVAASPPPEELFVEASSLRTRVEVRLVESPETIDFAAWVEPGRLRRSGIEDTFRSVDPVAYDRLQTAGAALMVPLTSTQKLIGFLVLGEKLSEEPFSGEDRELLLAVGSQLAVALEYGALIGEAAERERMRQELAIAQDVQAQLFPQRKPPVTTLTFSGSCRPAREVGGDYFDFIDAGSGGLGLAVGDISGKGVSAALLMASLQGALRSHATIHGARVATMFKAINRLMCDSAPDSKFATLFYAHYDDLTRTLTYASAGHNPALLIRRDAAGLRQVELLASTGIVLGVMPDLPFEQRTIALVPGDILVIYTDGITEAEDLAGSFFGEERLCELVATLDAASPDALRDQILGVVERFAAGAPQHDDMTVLVAFVR